MNPSIPGKAPRKADSQLTPEELARRDRRLQKVTVLENEIDQLKTQGQGLKDENQKLKEEIEKLRFQLQYNSNNTTAAVNTVKTQPTQFVNTYQTAEIPLTPTTFFVQTPLFTTATNLAGQNQFEFPPKLERLGSNSSFTDLVAVL